MSRRSAAISPMPPTSRALVRARSAAAPTRACTWPPTAIPRSRPSGRVGPRVEHAGARHAARTLSAPAISSTSRPARSTTAWSGAVTPATPVVAAAAVRDLEARRRSTTSRFFAERRTTVGSYVNVRFFGAYGPYEAGPEDHDEMAARRGGRPARVHGPRQRREPDRLHVRRRRGRRVPGADAARGFDGTVDFASGAPVTSTTWCGRWRGRSTST